VANEMTFDIESNICKLVSVEGPLTGLEIKRFISADDLLLWKTCMASRRLKVKTAGKRYLRLDRHVKGLARFSPSILREFFTYSVIGLASDMSLLDKRCSEIVSHINEISNYKYGLALRMVSEIMEEFHSGLNEKYRICFIIAGDIVYGMAHDVPRPERSTGRLVRGSDIDLVAVVEDSMPDAVVKRLDEIIYKKKYRMLIDPSVNEEVDYKIKKFESVREQAYFDNFKNMVASKILQEGFLLHGSETLFQSVKKILKDSEVPEKLDQFEKFAAEFREKAEKSILLNNLDKATVEEMHLFYSAEEFEEFE